jgi:predicted Rossmann fold flavoprotein
MTEAKKPLIRKDVLIIGAGASGLMCAVEAGRRHRSVIVLDHMEKIGKKIRAAGGGRCNFTNLDIRPDKYLSANPHFCKSALARFSPRDFIDMLERYDIQYVERNNGKLFCEKSSGEIVKMLHEECRETGVEMRLNCRIGTVSKKDNFTVSTNIGSIDASSLVIATGGLSFPELGASGIGYRTAEMFGLRVTTLKPALVPLIFRREDRAVFKDLSGISFTANVSCRGKHFRDEVLFTHRGLSGPAILQASSYWDQGDEITINLFPDMDAYELLSSKRKSRTELNNLLSEHLPRRFSHKWCELYASSRPLCTYTEKELKDIASQLHNWTIKPEGTEGYNKAEITLGGIDTDELSSKTMEAKKVPGLYFVGEVIDVSGQLGGYNLQWAWSSGFAAGQYA